MPVLLPEERVGSIIAEKYRIDAIIGRGGMGVVFSGHHEWTDRPVAVKLLNHELLAYEDTVRRFMQEAKAAARLDSPHVVDVLDMGKEPDGTVYMVLELLRGESLRDRLEREEKLSLGETLGVLGPIMEALADAHDHGIVHRDLKPDNIFLALDAKGAVVPKLLDFGVAKVAEASKNTKTGTMIGTPHYMSPEQVRGDSDTGPAADMWSVGVLVYECLSGELPYPGTSTTGILAAILTQPPRSLDAVAPELPASLVRAVMSTLEQHPEDRPPNMRSYRSLLERIGAAEGVAPVTPDVQEGGLSAAVDPHARTTTPLPPESTPRSSLPVGTPYHATPTGAESAVVPPTSRAPLAIAAAAVAFLLLGAGGMAIWLGPEDEVTGATPAATAAAADEPAAPAAAAEPTPIVEAEAEPEPVPPPTHVEAPVAEGAEPPAPAPAPVAHRRSAHRDPAPAEEPAPRPVASPTAPRPPEATRAEPDVELGANQAPILGL
ncbi:MAG: serine/threonine protein kinase [Sandaracinaceae bacterium]|nr:serine/threonine protein kinase [Sandaracinaceae bacterium]